MVDATTILNGSKNARNIVSWVLNFRGLVFLQNAIKVMKLYHLQHVVSKVVVV